MDKENRQVAIKFAERLQQETITLDDINCLWLCNDFDYRDSREMYQLFQNYKNKTNENSH